MLYHNLNKSEEHLQFSQLFNTQENTSLGLSYVMHARTMTELGNLLRSLRYLYSVITAYQHQWAQLHKDTIG